jgi:hypothetical protein
MARPQGKAKPGAPAAVQDLWTFAYQGTSGAEAVAVAFPVIELPTPKPLTVQFHHDTSLRPAVVNTFPVGSSLAAQPGQVHPAPNRGRVDLTIDQGSGVGNPGPGHIGIDNPSQPQLSTVIRVATHSGGVLNLELSEFDGATHVRIAWWVLAQPSFVRFALNNATLVVGPSTPDEDYIELDVTPAEWEIREAFDVDMTGTLGAPLLIDSIIEHKPNAIPRARITYTAGRAEGIQFECDWSGSLQLMASRVLIERLTVKADPLEPFYAQPIKIAAVILADGVRPAALPTLTERTATVATDSTITLPVPPLARRVSLLAIYGNEGAEGDIPLGQLFVAFASLAGNALAYIDGMSAREALFGPGLPIPAGAFDLGLSNRSADNALRLGVVWHLGV